ncbi:MAG: MaoC family dehydratase [Raoultibacter sp.]
MNTVPVKVPVNIGDTASFTKTISESDVYGFGGIIADFSPMHFNEEHAKTTPYGRRIVHGVLTFAFASTASTVLQEKTAIATPGVSYGYDGIRFIKPVFFGDTLATVYTVTAVDEEQSKSYGHVEIFNQHGDIVCACTHILKFLAKNEE